MRVSNLTAIAASLGLMAGVTYKPKGEKYPGQRIAYLKGANRGNLPPPVQTRDMMRKTERRLAKAAKRMQISRLGTDGQRAIRNRRARRAARKMYA